ncbi:sugar phosphate isomerase/epimerase family protein [Fimbriimonas ginsengisoli]|uniref:Xylose isomerase domain protein TIM barrel n=1 Tax=Fimbriimonas ginsengisoli Gsoil 348 TaxID=661478 RepID=A0A068NS13_FIMGI|nr:sugar phosphate isomerase/epimerase [Fimbriimonas ginsengisoli]AIE86117.1 Xylose isomerase domain protein TIM barrel [Fimbriimonas ginsengisoli Gsoil 348]
MKPLSIQLYTCRNVIADRGLPAVLKEISDIGYRGVEGGAGNGLSEAEFRSIVEDLGMVVSSTWGDVGTVEGAEKLVESCHALGTTYAAGGFWVEAFETRESIEKTAVTLNETLPILSNAGITFGLHNHWMEFECRDGVLVMDHLVRLVPNLKLELDIYWSSNFMANKPEEMVARYADRVALMHVKDGPQIKGEPMTAVGHGTVDVRACIEAANPAWLVVELDEYDGDMMDAVRDSHAYLTGNGLAAGK